MTNTKVFVSLNIPDKGIDLLRAKGFDVEVWTSDEPISKEELIEAAQSVQALITSSKDKLDAAFLEACSHLDIISQFAAGYDNIDIAAASRLGIPIGNTPDAVSDATADIAFGLMIAVSRKMFYMHKSIGRGEWGDFKPRANLGMELKNKTLGIFGLGGIGLEMALRCQGAYRMPVIYCNRNPNPEAEEVLGARRVSFDELLAQSDVLSVHCSLNESTRGIFDRAAFQKMKPSSIFINTSRGPVHRETDLIIAILNGEIWGAGLDVTDPEPMDESNPLLEMDTVAVVPHIGSATVEARDEMSRLAAQNIVEFYETGQFTNWVNRID
ncbi:2-hydroxyacid dehydrogenase [Flavilitoribacter nigricans]|uniref:D-glycerate dehydrogenase n=1 Tax=Flavilitoribacter nigricans (strain ATCC 23147 / DSM 23189 / NBRC 102662 / NCIMB 1420 / SS-2) TaxID=1122177 RepID=A0A2D0NJ24_FLAN2|nr:D-glycerate dehydrogenase [Flavilitoribacter nigricans]PHN08491.1 D-glycerate dehydrogenase [Flavilitoribacter nigricans DSM 23189 = NBRC 102662]